MSRARILALLVALALIVPGCTAKRPTNTDRPNVVVIMTDDQTVEEMRVMRNVKRLIADEGVTFENSFASYPVCCPSRATFLTGQYARNHGVLSNSPPRGSYYKLDGSNTLPVWLRDAGYDTIHIGKYLNHYGRRDPEEVPPGWRDWHGAIDAGYFDYRMNNNGRVTAHGSYEGDYEARVLTRKAVRAIRAHERGGRPFFLSMGFKAPHAGPPRELDDPVGVITAARSAQYKGRFSAEQLPASAAFNEADVSDKPPWNRRPSLSASDVQALTVAYRQELESLLSVDDAVKEIMDALDEGHLLDRTVVMFTSDNGVFHGEHRFGVSKFLPYEPALRVPLVIRGPGFPRGGRVSRLAVNIDLAPTIVELAGAKTDVRMDGRSFLDIFRTSKRWRNGFIVEGYPDEGARIPRYAGVRATRCLYVDYAGTNDDELYDLVRDPAQLNNVYAAKRYAPVLQRLKELYRTLSAEARR